MNKLFDMGRQLGTMMRQKIAMYLAMAAMDKPHTDFLPSCHWPAPDHSNSTAAADKRCARRRRNIAKRRG